MRASILIALESRKGEWCTPAWIASNVIASIDTVVVTCEQLVVENCIQFQLGDGTPLFGMGVVAEYPGVNDVADGSIVDGSVIGQL